MGRHSAPDEAGGADRSVVTVVDVATLLGRHSGSTGPIPTVHAAEDVETVSTAQTAETPRIEAPTATEAIIDPRPGPKPRPAPPLDTLRGDALPGDAVGLELIEDALAAAPPAPPVTGPDEVPPDEVPPDEVRPDDHAAQLPPVLDPEPAGPEGPSDLSLIRAHGDVRARCVTGLLVPFVIYVVALVLGGSLTLTTFLIWIWIPLISAGVLVGLFLDAGHKRYNLPAGPVTGSADRP